MSLLAPVGFHDAGPDEECAEVGAAGGAECLHEFGDVGSVVRT
ncbi:hypothetical protein SGL43_03131 [Streptomyces globisporus]|uniref:Uncharacterized protein n=1 Tax=Streptomyces globisporus TaxID=1908 RepID=A0ABN8V348_STRGL|nr:hypothetical protein SGL43_03131 [Streptomyces globisporus]